MSYFSKPLLWLMGSLFLQTSIKWLLTHGDEILVGALASLGDIGMYALAANYGGLVARMLFQPIEISSRNLFASLCATTAQQAENANANATEKDAKKESDTVAATEKANLQYAAQLLSMILRAYAIMSLVCFSLGPTAAPLLLRFVAGSKWTESGAGEVLGAYCYYIPLLAINGVSEAFVAATASPKDLRNQTLWMAGFSVLFATSAWTFLNVLQMGAKGLVWANCVNMALRVVFNLRYVGGYFSSRSQVSDA